MVKNVKTVSIEDSLWAACNKMRGSIDAADYKNVVLPLIFLKFTSDLFEEQRQKLLSSESTAKFADISQAYIKDSVFYLPPEARWRYIIDNSKQNDIATKIDTALRLIEKENASLKGALPDNYYSRLTMDITRLTALLDTINNINTTSTTHDIIGRVYEYFLKKFALDEGKKRGQYYTPKYVVDLIVNMIEPHSGTVYDPCCGSGGMFVQSVEFVKGHQGNTKDISIFGQEYNENTYRLAKMNFAIHALSANLGNYNQSGTLLKDEHPDLKADFIMANPPFNQKDWRDEDQLVDDFRWRSYKTPPKSNANYAWILHMVSKLSQNGVAGFLLANGALSSDEANEREIRKQLIENDLVEAICILPRNMFYTTDISVTLWILNRNKKQQTVQIGSETRTNRDRSGEVLFMDLRQIGEPYEKKYTQFSYEQIRDISSTFHAWRSGVDYEDTPEYCKSVKLEELKAKDYSLVPSKYIEFLNRDEQIGYNEKMKTLSADLSALFLQEAKLKKEVEKVFKELGYEL